MHSVVLFTWQYSQSKRRAGFHWLADAFWQRGWTVIMATMCISPLSIVRRDSRLQYPVLHEGNRIRWIRDRFGSYVWLTPFHPANLRSGILNRVSAPLFRRYGRLPLGPIEEVIKRAELLVFESTPGLLLFDRTRSLNPAARAVYRVSDDLRLINTHPVVAAEEARIAPRFDLISVPTSRMARIFEALPTCRIHPHGISKDAFDRPSANPFSQSGVNLVFAGNSHFDYDFLSSAARLFPDLQFHIIGPIPKLPHRTNVIGYGELPFAATIPFLSHADAGLQTRAYTPGAESLADSLKVHQYTYCRLPIIAPEFLRSERRHLFCYRPGDDASIRCAIESALAYDRTTISRDSVMSWVQVADMLSGDSSEAPKSE